MSIEKTYGVRGMTCGHCEQAVREAVERLPGVRTTDADHRSGRLVVTGTEFDDDAIRHAVETAGYALAAPGEA